jgi:hypothetical protein
MILVDGMHIQAKKKYLLIDELDKINESTVLLNMRMRS